MIINKITTFAFILLFPLLIIAQPFEQETKILATDGALDDMFGNSLSISGNFGVIGTPQDDDILSNSGAVYVYERSGDLWHVKAKLTIADSEEADMLGESVDIDEDYIVAGAYQAKGVGETTNTGAAYIFKRNGTSWDLQQKIFANDGEIADNFGRTVAISGDYIVVGSPNEDFGTGAIYIFHKVGETWTQVSKLIENDGNMNDYFGFSVDISGDYIVSGAWQNNAPDSNTGAAYVFYNNAGTWEFKTKLIANDAQVDDDLGYSVAISGDYIVASSHAQSGSKGAAYVFYNNAGIWEQQAKLLAGNGAGEDYFSKNVSISGDYILVGAQRHDNTKSDEGAAYLFVRSGTSWTQDKQFNASDESDTGLFGYCTAIDGNYAFISTIQDNGAVYVFGPEGLGINKINSKVLIYPNPSTGFLNLKTDKELQIITITDTKGKIMLQVNSENKTRMINITDFAIGLYFINIKNSKGVYTKKIIKK